MTWSPSGVSTMFMGRSPMVKCRPTGEMRQPFGSSVTFGSLSFAAAAGLGAAAWAPAQVASEATPKRARKAEGFLRTGLIDSCLHAAEPHCHEVDWPRAAA